MTRLPIERMRKVYYRFNRCLIKWMSPDRAEELIVIFNHNVINLYFSANKSIMYMSDYDKVYKLL